MTTYETISDYLLAWRNDSSLAAVSIEMAARARGVTSAEIEEMLEAEELPAIIIAKEKCISAAALAEIEDKERKQVSAAISLLKNAARLKIVVTCDALMQAIGLSKLSQADRLTFDRILTLIHNPSQTLYTALLPVLLRKEDAVDATPPDSFLAFVRQLKLMVGDEKEFVDEQTKNVWHFYSQEG